jgi:RNA polymerase sigma-70 factor (ECF subfamily)
VPRGEPPGEDDTALAADAAAGDVAAFTVLVRRHERRVRSFLARLCRSAEAADDLAQETFLQAWRMAASFRGEGSYQGWLLRIAWRRFLTQARAGRLEPLAAPAEAEPPPVPDPGAAIDLSRALAALDPRERAAALLCFGEGCSHQEAAAILELPLGTLKSLAARARTRLAAHLKGAEA